MSAVDLGFPEKCEPWELESRLFPSKLGGKPAWLDLKNLPKPEDLQCEVCKQQMCFLCQIYAPYEDDDDNFHRTIFVFVCRKPECCRPNSAENFKVFRSTLRRENEFYPAEPPKEEPDPEFTLSQWVTLCNLCGCFGEKHCSKCKEAVYCSREHQILDWKEKHKHNCCSGNNIIVNSRHLFPEFVIALDTEQKEEKTVNEEEQMQAYKRLEAEGKAGTLREISDKELEAHTDIKVDKAFSHFKKEISTDPDQIIRYERGGSPLFIAKTPKPEIIPPCEYCGGTRQFEFQIMPQMLSVLKETGLDWGVLLVYTCINSCTNSGGYKREFMFKQDVSADEA